MKSILEWLWGSGPDGSGARDWALRFIADFGPYTNYIRLALVLGLVAMIILILRNYRREGTAPRRAKAFLAGLRIAIVSLVLMALLRPAVVLQYSRTLYKSLVVLIDDSRSLGETDKYADAAQAKKLAETLNLAPGELRAMSREALAAKALAGDEGLLEKLNDTHALILMGYSTDHPGRDAYTRQLSEPLDAHAGREEARKNNVGRIGEILSGLQANGFETDIPSAIRSAVERVQGQPVSGVVLISDGQITTREADKRLASALENASRCGVPLYAVLVGDTTPPKDVAVAALRAPREVRRGSPVRFTAYLTQRNLDGQTVTVRLWRRKADEEKWVDTGVSAAVTFGEAGGDKEKQLDTVVLTDSPKDLGEFVYKAEVAPRDDERNVQDNAAETPLTVSDSTINVLLISSSGGWEYQYLRNFLLRQPDLYRVSTWQQNADREINQTASTGMKLSRLPRTLEELIGSPGGDEKEKKFPGYDVVILYDPMPTENGFDDKFVDLLITFVRDHGGGLCYIAGRKYTEENLRKSSVRAGLAKLLPVRLAPNRVNVAERIGDRLPQPWQGRLTSYGKDHPVMRLGGSAEEAEKFWRALPGVFWSHAVASIKPAARVLLESSNPMYRTLRKDPEPLVVVQPYGHGLTLYLGTDATWRWRAVNDGMFYRSFWSDVVRFLATLKARQIVITAGGERFWLGDRIDIEVQAYDEKFQPLKDPTLVLDMVNTKTGRKSKVTLKSVDRDGKPSGQYKGTIVADRTGTFELTLLEKPSETVAAKRIVIEIPQAESLRPEANDVTMRTVASRPDYFVTLDDVDQLQERIPSGKVSLMVEREKELWDTPFYLLVILALLVFEWIIRKKYNMA